MKPNFFRISALVLVVSVLGVSSCKEDEPSRLTLGDSAALVDEAVTDAYFQDLDDMAGVAIAAPTPTEYSSGRTSGTITIQDPRFDCEGIVVTVQSDATSTVEHPKGVLTVDFGTGGCTDIKGNVRAGKVIFTYSGKRFVPESSVITTVENYFINGVELEGTRTLVNKSNSSEDAPRFNVVLANGKATFPNELWATRQADITWQWNRAQNPLEDNLQIERTSTASGTTRAGRDYSVMLLEPLVYKRSCGIAVSGIKKYTIDGEREITIDYGDGTCDRAFTVTVNGVAHEISL